MHFINWILIHKIILIPDTVNIIERVNANQLTLHWLTTSFTHAHVNNDPDSAMRAMQNEGLFCLENNERTQMFLIIDVLVVP